jgi:hypothetical protein
MVTADDKRIFWFILEADGLNAELPGIQRTRRCAPTKRLIGKGDGRLSRNGAELSMATSLTLSGSRFPSSL